jgi:signal transduction histidine kinase
MLDSSHNLPHHIALAPEQLLTNGEIVVIVDDDAAITSPLASYLADQGLAVEIRNNAADLFAILREKNVALVLLDIGLPDTDGVSLIPQLVDQYPDLAIIMLTGVADLQVAMDCIRKGADDYLSKPEKFDKILFVVKKTLEKRRLIFENRKYQEDLEKAHFRIQLMHQLSLKMNSVYLSTVELDEILQAILVGITANEGLRFNRAFLAMFDAEGKYLIGRMAIGATCRDRAARIWNEMQQRKLKFLDIVHNIRQSCALEDFDVNSIIRQLRIPVSDSSNILIRSAQERRSIKVDRRNDCIPAVLERRNFYNEKEGYPQEFDRRSENSKDITDLAVPHDLIALLQEEDFVVVPLYSPGRPFGVIIADNFVTRNPIFDSQISALELFASQASLAIEHSHLYMDMQKKIHELEELNHELDKNKDMLIEAERYTALGQMAAQMVHAIRNPVTSIGGISRILTKKITDQSNRRYLEAIIKESSRLESILQALFDFVSQKQASKEKGLLSQLLHKTLVLLQGTIAKQHIEIQLQVMENEPQLVMDEQQIRQMMLHLLKNALEAMPDGGILFIHLARAEGNRLALSIRDSGTGISDSHIKQVTDSFFTTKTYGTGMGLTLVERIVKAHGGSFELHKLPVGLEVAVYLPLEE